ncbi:PhzF family phenazine biosynthesis protein [Enterobacteriaceae bacterium H20N1]|uniref:PhzF family phenazine biosynthesis protein n=1 Tax=Dryocola boscaweniae TaxID=2925397 RepID=A0A9X3AE74_9ENTR|nr:PhzF family phenazine biosynthesis protein [Dryocola boscaweniae]MCT4703818.1 PhzF family phenazine biosynthesis protein [Dryocola boscaweniae]MCT4716995.1 PhzF family phenazine biosynthesis protein [Dryocola boscaweniae]MCT4720986.1 PhzF family phenazine biosynthesis protein [Dryocola boscaweniae]
MQPIDFYMVDAFADSTFGGNAAAVCPLTEWLPDDTLLKMSKQHNQSETAFFVTTDEGFELRWFTTQGEINLCGHATLAAAHVIFEYFDYPQTTIHFSTRFVGPLSVTRNGEWLTLDFPAWDSEPVMPLPLLLETLGIGECKEVRVARDYMVVLESQQQVEAVRADINAMIPLDKMVCITAPGEGEYDFVSRFFCPGEAVPEDPVTGSTHSMLIPYWAEKLGKTRMMARQVSERGGDLRCQLVGDRVLIGGKAVTYLIGKVLLR